ncbi:MAG TPA: DUF1931 family protein [Actinomycetota bacterium]
MRTSPAAKIPGRLVSRRSGVLPSPITRGLQENIHAFRKLDAETGLEDVLEWLAAWPPLELALADDTSVRLPGIAGGLSVCLAQAFTLIDSNVKNPQTVQWERAFRLFTLLL